jgi:hypothetical protein
MMDHAPCFERPISGFSAGSCRQGLPVETPDARASQTTLEIAGINFGLEAEILSAEFSPAHGVFLDETSAPPINR